jgi:hypothetical protein
VLAANAKSCRALDVRVHDPVPPARSRANLEAL